VLECVTQCSQSAAHLRACDLSLVTDIWHVTLHVVAVLTGPTDWVCHIGTLMLCEIIRSKDKVTTHHQTSVVKTLLEPFYYHRALI